MTPRSRSTSLAVLLAALLLAMFATNSVAAQPGDLQDAAEICIIHDDFDGRSSYVDTECVAAVEAAGEEAAEWPSFDSTNLINQVLKIEQAREEAEQWPSHNPSGLAMQVLKIEQAREEAAGWANYDPSNIAIVAAHAPVANDPHATAF